MMCETSHSSVTWPMSISSQRLWFNSSRRPRVRRSRLQLKTETLRVYILSTPVFCPSGMCHWPDGCSCYMTGLNRHSSASFVGQSLNRLNQIYVYLVNFEPHWMLIMVHFQVKRQTKPLFLSCCGKNISVRCRFLVGCFCCVSSAALESVFFCVWFLLKQTNWTQTSPSYSSDVSSVLSKNSPARSHPAIIQMKSSAPKKTHTYTHDMFTDVEKQKQQFRCCCTDRSCCNEHVWVN